MATDIDVENRATVQDRHTKPDQKSTTRIFNIGTRRSALARVQTDEVVKALKQAWPEYHYEVHAMATTGDNNQNTALHKFNEKALWTQELEVLLQSGELDLIVHSLKDMPTQLPHDLELGCVTARKDPRDALVIKPSLADKYHSLADLPEGSVVGTSSLRRVAQMKRYYPHLRFASVRGLVGTRLAKLDDPKSEYSAIILAVAGMDRMGMSPRITAYLSKDNGGMLYAVGQGGLGIETRIGDERVQKLLSPIGCDRTTRQALAERSLMRTLEGGCSVPIGVETEWVRKTHVLVEGNGVGIKPAEEYHPLSGAATSGPQNQAKDDADDDVLTDEMIMRAVVVGLEGQEVAEVESRRVIGNPAEADQFGWDVARLLVDKGADKILEGIQLNRGIIHEQGDA